MTRRLHFSGFLPLVLTLLLGSACLWLPPREAPIPWMTKEELKARLGNPEFIVLDVRKTLDWDSSDRKIQSAAHEDYEEVKAWAGKYPRDRSLVLYCA